MRKRFTVKCSMKGTAVLCLGFVGFGIFSLFWLIIKNGVDPLLASVIVIPLFILPWLAGYLYLTLVSVTVFDSKIEFRNMFGITRKLDVKDIEKITWRVNEAKFGQLEKITVKSGSKKFSVETLMENSDIFFEYIVANVSEDKIIRKIRKNK